MDIPEVSISSWSLDVTVWHCSAHKSIEAIGSKVSQIDLQIYTPDDI